MHDLGNGSVEGTVFLEGLRDRQPIDDLDDVKRVERNEISDECIAFSFAIKVAEAMTMGCYHAVSNILNMFDVPLPQGQALPFEV